MTLRDCTTTPDSAWITQQARQFTWTLAEQVPPIQFLIRDNDGKFSHAFDAVFQAQHIEIVHTPFRAPRANAFAERWVRSDRTECLDHLVTLNQRHLKRVLTDYIDYYNSARPHQSLAQQIPILSSRLPEGPIRCCERRGGILRDYFRDAA